MRAITSMLLALSMALALPAIQPATLSAQGFLIGRDGTHEFRLPRPHVDHRVVPEQAYKIQKLTLQATLRDQVAQVQVSQTFVNTGSRTMEVCFVYPLPYDGAIDRMTFLVDGREWDAKLLTAEEARRIYEGHMRRNQDPALIEWMGRGMFKTSVFPVPPGASRQVSLRYSQICRSDRGLTELLLPLSTAKYTSGPVEQLAIDVTIQSNTPIKNVFSPTHSIDTQRPTKKVARISIRSNNQVPSSDFRLFYDVGDKPLGANLLSYRPQQHEEGYFLLLISPEIQTKVSEQSLKNIIFVIDRSGSMSGEKIDQAKNALKYVLNHLQKNDLFNIVVYDSAVESFKPELQRYSDAARDEALGFVEGIYPGGSTNIDAALQAALAQVPKNERPSYIVFLTDGLPTAGTTNEAQIVDAAEKNNKNEARIFSMGVGFDVNSRLLDKLARAGAGESVYVRPSEDIEQHVSRLYQRIQSPVLTDVQLKVDMDGRETEQGPLISRSYPAQVPDLFAGQQLVVVGRYKQAGAVKIRLAGTIQGEEQKYEFNGQLVEHSADESHAFVEKLWAMRRVGEIIDQIDLHGKNQELVDELVQLATHHGILTPYTSFLADETTDVRQLSRNLREANTRLEALEESAGLGGFAQRELKSRLQQAETPAQAGDDLYQQYESLQRLAGRPFGASGGMRAQPSQSAPAPALKQRAGARLSNVPADADAADEAERTRGPAAKMQNVGRKTFYWREGQWVDSTLTEEQEKRVQRIERYSREYFDLVRKHGKDAAKYLSLEGKVTVVLDGQAYAF